MLTKKKFALILITAGILSFLVGIYQFNQIAPIQQTSITKKSTAATSVVQEVNTLANRRFLSCEAMLTLSTIMIGLGSYLAGSTKAKNAYHHLTMDFTNHAKIKAPGGRTENVNTA